MEGFRGWIFRPKYLKAENQGKLSCCVEAESFEWSTKVGSVGGAVDDSRIEMEFVRTAWREKDEKKKETTER